MKGIPVTRCKDCSFKDIKSVFDEIFWVCTKANNKKIIKYKEWDDITDIPYWCPLPDLWSPQPDVIPSVRDQEGNEVKDLLSDMR